MNFPEFYHTRRREFLYHRLLYLFSDDGCGTPPVLAMTGAMHIPRPPGTSPGGSPISKLMGPPPLRGLCMAPITARAASLDDCCGGLRGISLGRSWGGRSWGQVPEVQVSLLRNLISDVSPKCGSEPLRRTSIGRSPEFAPCRSSHRIRPGKAKLPLHALFDIPLAPISGGRFHKRGHAPRV